MSLRRNIHPISHRHPGKMRLCASNSTSTRHLIPTPNWKNDPILGLEPHSYIQPPVWHAPSRYPAAPSADPSCYQQDRHASLTLWFIIYYATEWLLSDVCITLVRLDLQWPDYDVEVAIYRQLRER